MGLKRQCPQLLEISLIDRCDFVFLLWPNRSTTARETPAAPVWFIGPRGSRRHSRGAMGISRGKGASRDVVGLGKCDI